MTIGSIYTQFSTNIKTIGQYKYTSKIFEMFKINPIFAQKFKKSIYIFLQKTTNSFD